MLSQWLLFIRFQAYVSFLGDVDEAHVELSMVSAHDIFFDYMMASDLVLV